MQDNFSKILCETVIIGYQYLTCSVHIMLQSDDLRHFVVCVTNKLMYFCYHKK